MRLPALRHQARLYAGADQFVPLALDFLAPAVVAGGHALVITDMDKGTELRAALEATGAAGEAAVEVADMAVVGHNPALLLSRWDSFVAAHPREPCVWGISEPVWAARTDDEQVECRLHEAHLNLAFGEGTPLDLLCVYDEATLPGGVVDAVGRTHPLVGGADGPLQRSADFEPPDPSALLAEPLPPAPAGAVEMSFGPGPNDLRALRSEVEQLARGVGCRTDPVKDLVLAVDEAATNTVRHGAERGRFAGWVDGQTLVCEIRDRGRITNPLVGLRPPTPRQFGGRGLWIANKVCDLVQVRSTREGTLVRLHVRLGCPRVRPGA
jgi:anti-sigma regulatory factor (Ser/Thr protein kinase)